MNSGFDCAVVGGGLVGSAIAWGLVRQGLRTAMLDEGDAAVRASRGNFGLVWVQGKGRGMPAYARWSREASRTWPEFAGELRERSGVDPLYTRPGGALLALGEEELRGTVELLETLRAEAGNDGYEFEVLDHAQLAKRVAGIGPRVVGGTYCPYDGHANPLLLFRALHAAFHRDGGHYLPEHPVARIEPLPGGGFRIECAAPGGGARTLEAAKVVIAAGLGTGRLGAQVGLEVPVRPVQGQVLVTQRAAPLLDLPTNLVRQTDEGSFLLGFSQADVGFDLGTRADTLRDIAWRCVQAFPVLEHLQVVRAWAALRVMTPDGFPIYDQSQAHPGAFAACCHSGVTLAANHALGVAQWVARGTIPEAFGCFGSARFATEG